MKNVLKQVLLLSLCLGMSVPVFAEGIQKIGFINTERIYQESNEMQAIAKRLDKEFRNSQKKLDALQNQGRALQNKLLTDKKLTDVQKDDLKEQLFALNNEFLGAEARFMEDYNLRRNEEFAALQQYANEVITTLAKKENYDLILQDVVYVNGNFDITDQVIKMLNKK